jgi:predicted double-glycine peptidase
MLLAVLLTQVGCATSAPEAGDHARALSMAPQTSERFQCGPSTLASVLAFHGKEVPEEDIAKAIFSPTAKGVLLHDMAWFAREQGFQADVRTGSVQDLQQAVEARLPPIVLLDYGVAHVRKPHFTAITGVTDGGIFQLDDQRSDDYVRMNLFTRLWERAGNQYLVITPAALP